MLQQLVLEYKMITTTSLLDFQIAVIIPFRDRDTHLRILLNNMHPFLTKQMLDYSIIVVEQVANQTLNRAKVSLSWYLNHVHMYGVSIRFCQTTHRICAKSEKS